MKRVNLHRIISEEINKFIINETDVYHGSGARFKNFSTDFENSGEGSQSFGPGLYFTNSKDIGRDYVKQHDDQKWNFKLKGDDNPGWLSGYVNKYVITSIISVKDIGTDIDWDFVNKIEEWQKTIADKSKFIRLIASFVIRLLKLKPSDLEKGKTKWDEYDEFFGTYTYRNAVINFIDWLKTNIVYNERSLYQVEIPDDSNFLDWNGKASGNIINRLIKYVSYSNDIRARERFDDEMSKVDKNNMTNGQLYTCLENSFYDRNDSDFIWKQLMKNSDYKGFKYPAGQNFSTKHTKRGDYNYTVLNDKDIKMKKRWDY